MSRLDYDAHIAMRDEGIRVTAYSRGRAEGYAEAWAEARREYGPIILIAMLLACMLGVAAGYLIGGGA